MKIIISLILVFIQFATLLSQSEPSVYRTKKIQGVGHATMARMTHEGCIIILTDRGFLVKCDYLGNIFWIRSCYENFPPAAGRHYKEFGHIIETTDQEYVVCGSSEYYGSHLNPYIVKLDEYGRFNWLSIDLANEYDRFDWIEETSDHGFVVTGINEYDYSNGFLVKFNEQGDTLWTKEYGGSCVKETPDNGFIISGSLRISDIQNLLLYKSDASGQWQWLKFHYKDDSDRVNGKHVIPTSDGGYIVVADYYIRHRDQEYPYSWILQCNAKGDTLWTRDIEIDFKHIEQTADNGIVMIGIDDVWWNNSDNNIWIVKLNERGERQWTKEITSLDEFRIEYGAYVAQKSEIEYLVISNTLSLGYDDLFTNIQLDYLILNPTNLSEKTEILPDEAELYQNYPNPFNPTTNIEFNLPKSEYVMLDVYNIVGERVTTLVSTNLQAGNHTYEFDGSNLSSGIYFYKLTTESHQETKKMILMK